MTNNAQNSLHDTVAAAPSTHVSGRSLVSEFKAVWRRGEQIDTGTFLARRIGEPLHKSALLDLAYEEYCLKRERGQTVDANEFASRFPAAVQQSLSRLLNVHQFIADNTEIFDLRGPIEWPEAGDDFLGFELIEELGRGAFARVFLAREIALAGRQVVVKVAQQGPAEAEIIAKLQHANIVPIYSVIEDAKTGLTALCMPFKGRSTLGDLVEQSRAAKQPPDVDLIRRVALIATETSPADGAATRSRRVPKSYSGLVLEIAEQVASAIAYAHGKGICHQDLKPSNVLLGMELEPLLLDFNLSADGRSPERIGGTLPYMAPEQLRAVGSRREGTEAIFDPKSDVFAWAAMTWEVLSGELPFAATDKPTSWQDMLESRRRPRLGRTLDGEVDRTACALIRDCLQFDAALRPTATEVVRRLKTRHRLIPRLMRWLRTNPRKASLGACGAALLCVAGAAFAATRPPSDVRHFQAAQAYFDEGRFDAVMEELNLSLSQRRSPEALCLRGRVHLAAKDFTGACDDFYNAHKLTDQPELLSAMAYCRASAGSFAVAAFTAERAIAAGCRNAVVYNNLGFAYSQQAKLTEAIDAFGKAIQLDDRLQAPYLGRVRAALNLRTSGKVPDLKQAEADIAAAMKLGPLPGNSLANAARVRILLRPGMPVDAETIALLKQAVANGFEIHNSSFGDVSPQPEGMPPESFFAQIQPRADVPKPPQLLDPTRDGFTVQLK